jgi:methylmalonyl-CoA mutase
MFEKTEQYKPKNQVRIVTASALFDGHDAAINIMRRLIQNSGCEVIHLGHNRAVKEIVNCAIQEDAQAIAITSYQGGHTEFLKYMYDLLQEADCGYIKIFAGGGGVILPDEMKELQNYGITRIYSPDDGRTMGLIGMINHLVESSDFPLGKQSDFDLDKLKNRDAKTIAGIISAAENYPDRNGDVLTKIEQMAAGVSTPVLGITGTGGSGKSSLVDELVNRFLHDFKKETIAIISVDPSKRRTGGALLGDRIRMNSIDNTRVYMRSLATRQSNLALSKYVRQAVNIVKAAGFDLIILETSGIGQSDTEITDHSDLSLYVMTPDYGASSQLEKIDMLDFADLIALNKSDKGGALDGLRDVKKQYRRNHNLWEVEDQALPVYGTIASQFNDPGVNILYSKIMEMVDQKSGGHLKTNFKITSEMTKKDYIIPPNKIRYLSEISDTIRSYNSWAENQAEIAEKLYCLEKSRQEVLSADIESLEKNGLSESIEEIYKKIELDLSGHNKKILENWENKKKSFQEEVYVYRVRDKEIKVETKNKTLCGLNIPKISVPGYRGWGDILKWSLQENFPGEFPFTAGVFPFKREGEDPTRMFAGEGGPERTNRRFHYVSHGQPAKRLSTAFDSVTLYGEDPDPRPDIFGKIGNAGVSICCLDDAKKLYSGFRLCDPKTSVSMTINGPAAIMVGYFMNAAVDQECEIYIRENSLEVEVGKKIEKIYQNYDVERPAYQGELPEGHDGLGLFLLGVTGDMVLPSDVYERIKKDTICRVRGTVQADILKEDQAQNTCIFSIDIALKIMGDIQEYFIQHRVKNFYSVSISGYHIAEAGANLITQMALTLSNGFTFIEYYLARGMDIDKFAPSLSFFFSNGLEPEYAVIGRVARRIWAKAIKLKYKGNVRSQLLKYHIQTSGRSLHAQEIDFNDIRTTLQALYAVYDNCNSLHTNSYDEAITTPTEESVRRAIAIQLIINKEFGLTKCQNPNQGSFIIEELTDLVEEAVLLEFDRISQRGGVLGAMETNYQRGKIQEESHHYESMKNTGEYPIVGVNTFLSPKGSNTVIPGEVIRATKQEKEYQVKMLDNLLKRNQKVSEKLLQELQKTAINKGNIFEKLMEVTKHCSLGQISRAIYRVGGQYRRNM